jgi:hypothetical protein
MWSGHLPRGTRFVHEGCAHRRNGASGIKGRSVMKGWKTYGKDTAESYESNEDMLRIARVSRGTWITPRRGEKNW